MGNKLSEYDSIFYDKFFRRVNLFFIIWLGIHTYITANYLRKYGQRPVAFRKKVLGISNFSVALINIWINVHQKALRLLLKPGTYR